MTFNDVEFKACPRCGTEPVVDDMRGDPRRPNLMSATCPVCQLNYHVLWLNVRPASLEHAVAMLADSWNGR